MDLKKKWILPAVVAGLAISSSAKALDLSEAQKNAMKKISSDIQQIQELKGITKVYTGLNGCDGSCSGDCYAQCANDCYGHCRGAEG